MDSQGDTRPGDERLPQVLRCEELMFDPRRRVVTLRGVRVDLSTPYLDALFLLIEKRPMVVPKQELAKAARTTEDTLYKVIETIRRALGDIDEPRRFILNERGVGYQFIGEASPSAADAKANVANVEGGGSAPEIAQPGHNGLDPTPPAQQELHGALRRRWLWLTLVVFCFGAILAGTALLRRGNRQPASLSLDGRVLVAKDASGREIWRHLFEHGFYGERYGQADMTNQYWIGDLDGDGSSESLFVYDAAIPGAQGREESTSLFCFTQAGKVKWKFQVGRTVRDSSGKVYPPFGIDAMRVVFSAGPRPSSRIVVASGHPTDQAFQLAFLNAAGNLVAEYWHPGSLYTLRCIPAGPGGAPRLLAGGVNNGEHQATLVELDPFAMTGVSTPSRMKDQMFRLLDMPEAHEELVILFPRTSLSGDEPYTRVGTLSADDRGVHVMVIESYNPRSSRTVYYDFDLSLRLTRAFVSSNYREEHMKLEQSGAIRGSWRDDEARLAKGLQYRRNVR